jgi:hypothetical protein
MLQAVIACLKRVFSDVSTWGGALSGAVGWLSDLIGRPLLLPSWAWWLLAVLLVFIAACRAHWELLKIQNANPEADMKLEDAVARITGVADIPAAARASYSTVEPQVRSALDEIRQRALLGQIQAFGRTSSFMGKSSAGPLDKIPQSHWKKYEIKALDFLADKRGYIGPDSGSSNDEPFSDIYFSSAQISQRWPPPRHKIKWPFTVVYWHQ